MLSKSYYIYYMEIEKQNRIYKFVGDNIRLHRGLAKLTQDELAARVGLSRASIVNIEKARQQPSLHLLIEIAECLNIDLHDLIPRKALVKLEDILEEEELRILPEKDLTQLNRFLDSHLK